MGLYILSFVLAVFSVVLTFTSVTAFSDDAVLDLVFNRLDSLEHKERLNQDTIQRLQEDAGLCTNTIQELRDELAAKDALIQQLARRLGALEKKPDHLVQTFDEPEPSPPVSNGGNGDFVARDDDNEDASGAEDQIQTGDGHRRSISGRLIVNPEVPVAFHALVNPGTIAGIGAGQNIHFDNVLLNLGTGYHSQHGIFIAPASGLYLFSATIMSYVDPLPEFQAELVKDGSVLGRIFVHGDNGREDQSALTVLVQLTVGQEVWLRQHAGSKIYGSYYSSFAGVLLLSQ